MSLHQIFKTTALNDRLDKTQFADICSRFTNNIFPRETANELFEQACKEYRRPFEKNKTGLSFKEFEAFFRTNIVATNQADVSRRTLKILKEWMTARRYDPKQAFQMIMQESGAQGLLIDRLNFHKAVIANGM